MYTDMQGKTTTIVNDSISEERTLHNICNAQCKTLVFAWK